MTLFRAGQKNNTSIVVDPVMDDYYNQLSALNPWSDEWYQVAKEANLRTIQGVYYINWPVTYYFHFWQPWVKNYDGQYTLGAYHFQVPKFIWIDEAVKKSFGH